MGFLSKAVGQVIVSSIVLGALKHKGAISIHPAAFDNESARTAFTQAVQLGEMATVMTERFFDSLMGEINNSGSGWGKKK